MRKATLLVTLILSMAACGGKKAPANNPPTMMAPEDAGVPDSQTTMNTGTASDTEPPKSE